MPKWVGLWVGGRIADVNGQRTWYIRKHVGSGVRKEFNVATTEADALAEWALFQRDPENYQTRLQRAASAHRLNETGAVPLDDTTLRAFLDFCDVKVAKGELTRSYVDHSLEPYLDKWAEKLGGRDLHKTSLDQLQRILKTWTTARHKRIVALKAFAAWAREEKDSPKLRRRDDPTLDLKTPAIIPAKSVHAKGYPMALVAKFYAELISQATRDMLCLRAKLGLHDTEIGRVASGEGVLRRVSDPSGIEGVIIFAHLKKGKMHAVSCDAQTFAAAERMQTRRTGVSRRVMKLALDRAAIRMHGCGGMTTKLERRDKRGRPLYETKPCDECVLLIPNELRHSFATWATTVGEAVDAANQRGVELAKVAEHLGHLSKRTTSFFYVGDRVPTMIRLPLKLEHPSDPIPLAKPGARREEKRGR